MRKFFKKTMLILGGVVMVAAIVFAVVSGIRVWNVNNIAASNRPQEYVNPLPFMYAMGGCALVGGLLLGAGLATPSKGFKQQYEERQAEAAQKIVSGGEEHP